MKSDKKMKRSHLIAVLFLLFIIFFTFANLPLLAKSGRNIIQNRGRNITSEISTLTSSFDENFHLKYAFLDLNGMVHKFLGKSSMNNVTRLNNGYLASLIGSGGTMERQSQMMTDLYKVLEKRNTPMLYVQAPGKISRLDKQLPAGLYDHSNDNTDNFIRGMREGGIPVLDIREEIEKEGLDHYSMFFKTDHHWTPHGGFFAYTKIMEKLADFSYTEEPNKLDLKSYEVEEYKEHFLGSTGRRTGALYAGVDDITLIYPSFETKMSISVPSRDIYRSGSFKDVIFDYTHIEEKDFYNKSPYSTYIGGDYPLVIHENDKAANDQTILLIRDSFSLPVQSFLSLSISNLHVIDLRYYTDQTLLQYIDELNPDMVMFLYNVNIFGDDSMFQFGMEDRNNLP